MQYPDARILIFAKAPVGGQVKTRLIPLLGEQGALELYLQCLHQIIEQRCEAQIAPVIVCCTDCMHPVLQTLAKRYPIRLEPQQGADLGERMRQAAQQNLVAADIVMLTGVDAPSLTNQDIRQGIRLLRQQADVVISPAEDGGYVMLGLQQDHAALFVDIPWGTGQVAYTTRQRCIEYGLNLVELPTRWDIDRPADVWRFYRQSTGFDKLWM